MVVKDSPTAEILTSLHLAFTLTHVAYQPIHAPVLIRCRLFYGVADCFIISG